MRTEDALRDSEERYRLIVELGREGICVVDAGGNTTFANHALADLLDTTVNELLGSSLLRLHRRRRPGRGPRRASSAPTTTPRDEQDLRLVTVDRRLVWARIRCQRGAPARRDLPRRDRVRHRRDRTPQRSSSGSRKRRARDPLTGVANRKELFEVLVPHPRRRHR